MRKIGTDNIMRKRIVGGLILAAMAFGAVMLFQGNMRFQPAWAANSQSVASNLSTSTTQQLIVRKGDTLLKILEYAGVTRRNATAATIAVKKVFNPKKLRVGQRIFVKLSLAGNGDPLLSVFSIKLGKNSFIQVTRRVDGKFHAHRASRPWPRVNKSVSSDHNERPPEEIVSVQATRGQTIGKIIRSFDIRERDIDRAVKALKTHFDPRKLKVGQKISVLPGEIRNDGKRALGGFAVHLAGGSVVNVRRISDGVYSARRNSTLMLGVEIDNEIAEAANLTGVVIEQHVPKGAILMNLLTTRGISRTEADKAIRALRVHFNPRRLRAGQIIHMIVSKNETQRPVLQGFSLALGNKRHVIVIRQASGSFTSALANTALQSLAHIKSNTTNASKSSTKQVAPLAKPQAPTPVKPLMSSTRKTTLPNAAAEQASPSKSSAQNRNTEDQSDIIVETITINRGDTLMSILRSEGIDRFEADRAIRALRKKFNPRRLREGQKLVLVTRTDKAGALTLEGFSIEVARERHIEVLRSGIKKFSVSNVKELNFAKAVAVSEASRSAESQTVTKEDVQFASRPRPGQGQAMSGAIIAAAALTEFPLKADPAQVWPNKKSDRLDALANLTVSTAANDDMPADGFTRKTVTISKGDTLFVALTKAGSDATDAEAAIAAFRSAYNPRNIQIGQTLTLGFEPLKEKSKTRDFRLAEFTLDVAPDRDILVARQTDDSFHASEVARDLLRRLEKADGHIETSLYAAAMGADLPISILMELVQIFSFDVDFQREIQKEDRFEALYENLLNDDGESVALGPVLFASLTLSGQPIELYRHEPTNGPVDYFNSKGQSARKALMRTPINGARLSSGYGMRRHPVLGYNKMHRGLDFAAPRGTPVVAAGDGVIERIGRYGAYGKYIRIRHNSTYKTAYAHLNSYARGMKTGKRVRQGQTIGYVGSTGRSTGPHLHYEVLRGNKQINPRKLKLPTGQKLKGKELALFEQQVQKIRVLVAEVPNPQKITKR